LNTSQSRNSQLFLGGLATVPPVSWTVARRMEILKLYLDKECSSSLVPRNQNQGFST